MRHIVGNGQCSIYHTRSLAREPGRKPEGPSSTHMLINHDVHVLELRLERPGFKYGREKDRVRVQVRLWKGHTPYFEIRKFECVSPVVFSRDELILRAGEYLQRFQLDIYRHLGIL
jgi:hypothetical protein